MRIFTNRTTNGSSDPVTCTGMEELNLHIWSTAGAVANVDIEQSIDAASPYRVVATMVDPDAEGEIYSLPPCELLRVTVRDRASGSIQALATGKDYQGGGL